MREDPDWCNQVIDLCIEQVLQDVNIVQLINDISGTASITIKKRSKSVKQNKTKNASEPELITPPFSATEPHTVSNTSPRRIVKEMNKRKPVHVPSASASATATQLLKKALHDKVTVGRSMSVESSASTVPVTDSFNNGIIISTNANTKREAAWVPNGFEKVRSESSISSENENDLYVSVLDSEAQASFRDDADYSHLQDEDRANLGETSKLDLTNRSLDATSEADSLDETAPTPPRSSAKVLEMTQNIDRRELTLGGKNRTAGSAAGQKIYKVPYKPTTFDGKLKGNAAPTVEAAPVPIVLAASSPSSIASSPSRPQVSPNLSMPSRTPPTPLSVTPKTPLMHTHSVGDDFLASWEKQVIQGMKSGDDESDGMDENDALNLTPSGSGFENSFVDQLVRSPSKTLNGDLDQYELYSEQSDATPSPEQPTNPSKLNQPHKINKIDPVQEDERAQSTTPELNVISSDAAQSQEPLPSRAHCMSIESDLTDPTGDSPRPEKFSHLHSHHHGRDNTNEAGGVHVQTIRNKQEGDEENDVSDDSSDSYSSDSSVSSDDEDAGQDSDTEDNDYLRAPPTQTGSLLFFDQSRFDADADYFASEGAKKAKSPPKKTKPKKKNPSDSPPRVRFAPRLISEVHYRDRVGYHEKGELFFTHNEEYQFTMDQSKEAERAEALGMTWMEWMEQRTDEDVQREEQENDSLNDFKLYSGEYYEESDNNSPIPFAASGYSTMGGVNSVPHGDHDFKAGNAHVSPVIAHHHAPHVLTTQQVLATHGKNNISNVKNNGVEVVFSDELSVPSCSTSEDDEYDLNDF
eukprot:gene14759-16925_t